MFQWIHRIKRAADSDAVRRSMLVSAATLPLTAHGSKTDGGDSFQADEELRRLSTRVGSEIESRFRSLATSGGAAQVGFDSGSAQDVLDNNKPMPNYPALRAYSGRAKGAWITEAGISGEFQRDDTDSTSTDNGATVIVDAAGRRWKRPTVSNILYAEHWGIAGSADPTNRLQKVIDEAIARQEAVRIVLPRDVVIDGTINLNTRQTRYPIYFEGGSLRRTNPTGFMFDGTAKNNSDIFFTATQFRSTPGSGAKIFNGEKIIRLQTRGCSFRGVDTVLKTTDVAQSYRSIGDIVAGGGSGYAFDLVSCYDTVFDSLLMEQRDSGIRVQRHIYDLKITQGCIEGLTGQAIQLGDDEISCYSHMVLIEGVYFEANKKANIRLGKVLNRVGPITVRKCNVVGHGTTGTPAYAEYLIDAGGYGNGGLFSERNFSAEGIVIDVSRISGGHAYSRWDRNKKGYVFPDDERLRVEGHQIYKTAGGVTKTRMGDLTRLYRSISQSIAPSTTVAVTFDFGTPINLDDIVSPQMQIADGATLSVSHCYRQGNLVRVWVTNKSAGTVIAPLSVTVLKMPFSVSG